MRVSIVEIVIVTAEKQIQIVLRRIRTKIILRRLYTITKLTSLTVRRMVRRKVTRTSPLLSSWRRRSDTAFRTQL